MKINFNLRDCKAVRKTSIVLVVRHYQKTLKLATGLNICPTDWDVKKQRPIAGKFPYLREQLNQIEATTEKVLISADVISQNELSRLYALPLSGKDELIRDCFLIGCLSGQRWSDYGFINPFQVRDGLLTIHQQEKTENFAEVELDLFSGLLPFTLGDMLAKYGNQSPTLTRGNNGSVVFNRSIKFLCRRAAITAKIEWITTNGGTIKTEMLEKWQVVSSHTCRRSFATLWAKMGLPLADIASATGHATEKQLMEYVGLSHEEKRDKRRVAVDAIKAKQKAI